MKRLSVVNEIENLRISISEEILCIIRREDAVGVKEL